jgi:hypothetical protein
VRCEAGARYAPGTARVIYACGADATVELVSPDLVLLQWCDAHAAELGPVFLRGRPALRIRPVTGGTAAP